MYTLTNLLKDHQIGTWCKRAAWFVLVIGLVEIALTIYNDTRQFGFVGQPFTLTELLQILGFGLGFLPSVLFYFFILYAAGAVVNHVVGTQAIDDEEEEEEADEEQDATLRQ
jgi:hypothetical protein